ncbi:SixA phosphatase family protein [Mucilaginibacter gilvus]|uniref:Histidine phosphatase family protein n=1 Tax=Mucilaginibacter gilvus TaxID=2305909 RepID=A0A3S3VNK6_9SPHI|nr:histidine phosphatase family protein [Mucilaginibacter gilvus]RWY52341.1 histidine phosphatase family protein [Mucilaginibacter gilvus]
MKNVLLQSKILKVLFVCLFLSNYNAFAQKTTIWLVRHGEKEPATVKTADDPNLSLDGQKRAEALAKFLKREKIKAIYITKYKRTSETARPLAAQARIVPQVYGDSLKTFAAGILKSFNGSNVLIIGHSTTLMPLLGAFGAEMPFEALDEDDFDMIFKVTIKDSGERELEISYYGSLHHKSDLPQKYKEDNRPAQQFVSPAAHY